MRARFGCHVYIPRGHQDRICVMGHSHDIIRQIVRRLRTLWSETIASSNFRSKVYVVELPESSFMKKDIIVKNDSRIAKPLLYGDSLSEDEIAGWRNKSALVASKNDSRLLKAIDKSLQGIMFVRGHLRMRVNFGSFVLDHYRNPKNQKKAYSFEEFREMLLHQDTRGRLIPGYDASFIYSPVAFTS